MNDIPYILPLLWLHGEAFSTLEREIREMHRAGLRGFILESRPFPDYMGTFWWKTLHFVLELAEKLEMKVMLFDDSHFPSGYADGKIATEHPEYLRLLLRPENRIFHYENLTYYHFNPCDFLIKGDQKVERIWLLPLCGENIFDVTGMIEVPTCECDIAIPAGKWMLNIWIITRNGGEEHTKNYINFLSPDAVKCYIDTIYMPHIKKLQRFIGRSFIGFFSDEPRLGNAPSYYALPGKEAMNLPYYHSLDLSGLPHLMMNSDNREITGRVRQHFMDQVSCLYSKAFPQQIGKFCQVHNLLYIGHIVEDNGAHSRLGYGCGHYFRSQTGQSWAGVDTVLGQNRPEHTDGILSSVFGQYESRFFHWELMLLAGSCGAINDQPAFVENFGAYGWNEGLSEMKWHTDLALVRGVNRVVPHAFSLKYPDPDCPPHFFAQGDNPQWSYFHLWREYTDTTCQILSNGYWMTRCGVLYHAEAEWSTYNTLYNRDVIRTLNLAQYSCVIVPLDALQNRQAINGRLQLGKVTLDTLIVSDFELLPEESRKILSECGLRLIKINQTELSDLPERIGVNADHLSLTVPAPTLRYLHLMEDSGSELYFLVNESMIQTVDTQIINLTRSNNWIFFDPIRQENYFFDGRLLLEPGEAIFLSNKPAKTVVNRHLGNEILVTFEIQEFDVSPVFNKNFSGTLHYTKYLGPSDVDIVIKLPSQRSDVVSCFVNGMLLGTLFAPPYRFFISRELLKTPAVLRLDFTNSLAPRFRDGNFDRDVEPAFPGLKSKVILLNC